jgi:beta-xylosidase
MTKAKNNLRAISYYIFTWAFMLMPGKFELAAQTLRDTDDNTINAHGAGILFHEGVYYLFGEIKKGDTWLVPDQPWECYRVPAGGISCYSSKDLKTWKNEGVALATYPNSPVKELDTGRVLERPKVIYNSQTKKFVMWMHTDDMLYNDSKCGLAVSDSPTGPYTFAGSVNPNGQMARDMTLFKDDDGKAYLIYASEKNATMHICQLSDDYLEPTANYKRIFKNNYREAPAMFKAEGKYFMITSGCSGWSPNAANYAVGRHPLGPWKQRGNPCKGPGAAETFQAQSTFVLPLENKQNEFLFMADRWNKLDLESSTYLWLPFKIHKRQFYIELTNKKSDF